MIILIVIVVFGGLIFLFVFMFVLANKKLYVYEDLCIDMVEDMLLYVNCGVCGYFGCCFFVEVLVGGEVLLGKCMVSFEEVWEWIVGYLGVVLGNEDCKVVCLACVGGVNVVWVRVQYEGMWSCQVVVLVSGGGKGCFWGCLGYGDCEVVCDFDVIQMDEQGLLVVDIDKCMVCGDCVEVCFKGLFFLEFL